jgi:hypothetical protein
MKKQTAVEWLEEELADNLKLIILNNDYTLMEKLFEQAKSMEKEQKKFMFDCGRQYQLTGEGTFTEVYNETYKGGNNE